MFKSAHLLKNKIVNNKNFVNTTKRFYRESPIKPPTNPSYASWALIGAGTAGIGYLMLYGRNLTANAAYYGA